MHWHFSQRMTEKLAAKRLLVNLAVPTAARERLSGYIPSWNVRLWSFGLRRVGNDGRKSGWGDLETMRGTIARVVAGRDTRSSPAARSKGAAAINRSAADADPQASRKFHSRGSIPVKQAFPFKKGVHASAQAPARAPVSRSCDSRSDQKTKAFDRFGRLDPARGERGSARSSLMVFPKRAIHQNQQKRYRMIAVPHRKASDAMLIALIARNRQIQRGGLLRSAVERIAQLRMRKARDAQGLRGARRGCRTAPRAGSRGWRPEYRRAARPGSTCICLARSPCSCCARRRDVEFSSAT
jgi:hypothetical protein